MGKRLLPLLFVAFILAVVGCSKNTIVNIDGMPVSNYEYQLTNQETKIRAVIVLARYYSEDEGDGEFITKPEFLDAMHVNRIDRSDKDRLILHVKVVNLARIPYSVLWSCDGPTAADSVQGHLYSGKLSRKDFYIKLPLTKTGDLTYTLHIEDADGDDLYDLPLMRYKVKGGGGNTAQNNVSQ
jgi:hypothetical protein